MSDQLLICPRPEPATRAETAGPRKRTHFELGHISPVEWRRRLLHILPGFLPLILWWVPHRDPLSWDCRAWLGLIIVGIGLATAIRYRKIARDGEVSNPACILGYTIPVFGLLMLVPKHPQIGLGVLAIVSFGDGCATLGGLLMRGPALPWNRAKTWAGFLCFLVCAAPMSALMYWAESRPAISFAVAFQCGAFATVAAAIAESLASRIDDNIRVGAAAAVGLLLAHAVLLGL